MPGWLAWGVGRGNGERGEPPSEQSPSCPGHAQPMMGSEMQQVTVAAAGFEHARAGTAETHLAKEKVHPAALSQAKLPLPFPGREGTGDEGEMKQRGKLILQCFPRMGAVRLPCLQQGGAAVPQSSQVPQVYAQGSPSLPALSWDGGSRQRLEPGSERAPQEQGMPRNSQAGLN